MRMLIMLGLLVAASMATAGTKTDYLVKVKEGADLNLFSIQAGGSQVRSESLGGNWFKVTGSEAKSGQLSRLLSKQESVILVQPNYPVRLLEDYQLRDPKLRSRLQGFLKQNPELLASDRANQPVDNPEIPLPSLVNKVGPDPMAYLQWGMTDIGSMKSWIDDLSVPPVTVAVIDTGVDYTHEDLAANLWRNSGEMGTDASGRDKSKNGIDDDNNGYIDDLVGWDFASNDSKPYDLTKTGVSMIIGGGNPGHGTHCAGNVGAVSNNGKGIAGVSNKVHIMALRFISEKGQGTTDGAIKAIRYAVDNGAKVLSNSWGSEGEDPNDNTSNQALRDAIAYAQSKGVLFVAAAGNGHNGVGYDNDVDERPAFPASYPNENIISVAALNNSGELGAFSNWGSRSVDIGAPGVRVFSTVPGSKYQDKIDLAVGPIDIGKLIGLPDITWDGTSMATPHVAGAAALYWAKHPEKTWSEVKDILLTKATRIPSLQGKCTSQGKLDVSAL